MVFWWVPYLAIKCPRSDFYNGSGDNLNCGCILGSLHLFEFDLNNDPSPGNSSLGSDGSTSVHLNLWSLKTLIIHLTSVISGPRLDFNNCPCDNLNNSCNLTLWRLFVSNSSNGPRSLQSWSNERYTCSGLPLMVSWWVQYLAKCPTPDFNMNNGPEDNLNSGCILVPSIYSSLI